MKIWIATVSTRYEITAVDTDPETAVTTACRKALAWLHEQGVTEHRTVDEVREYFGVGAYAVTVGEAVVVAHAEYHN
jgi:hypothetical protein